MPKDSLKSPLKLLFSSLPLPLNILLSPVSHIFISQCRVLLLPSRGWRHLLLLLTGEGGAPAGTPASPPPLLSPSPQQLLLRLAQPEGVQPFEDALERRGGGES